LDTFERKVLRRIIGPIYEGGRWRRRYNNELYSIYKDSPIRRIVKSLRLRWAGHVARMDDTEIPKKILSGNPGGQRGCGRPRTKWLDRVEEDLRKLGYRNWKVQVQNRDNWQKIVEEAKIHNGL
jgi:transcription termination factor 2